MSAPATGTASSAVFSDAQQSNSGQPAPSESPSLRQLHSSGEASCSGALASDADGSHDAPQQLHGAGALQPNESRPSHSMDVQPRATTSSSQEVTGGERRANEDPPISPTSGAHIQATSGSEKIQAVPPQSQPSASDSLADDVEKAKTGSLAGGAARADSPDPLDAAAPPPLNYTLRTRKASIAIFWSLILIDSIAIPLVLYFCLHYLTSLSPNAVFSISTACLGGISIVEYFVRFWRLWRHNSTCRVIGARRWYLDWFHWNFSAAWIFIMAELIVGTSPDYPPIRLLAMPLSSLCFWFCLSLLTQDIMRIMNMPSPIRISSVPKGEPLRPGIYSIIEDICAVDGSGGTEFRQRLNARFEASHYFRQMLHRLTLVWAIGMLIAAIATTILIFTLDNEEIAYILGWTIPFVWAGLLTLWTFYYVKRCLKREYAKWAEQKVL